VIITRRSGQGNAHLLCNVACMQARWESSKETAQKDDDFESLREGPRFLELVS
jgi:hypothetical protein